MHVSSEEQDIPPLGWISGSIRSPWTWIVIGCAVTFDKRFPCRARPDKQRCTGSATSFDILGAGGECRYRLKLCRTQEYVLANAISAVIFHPVSTVLIEDWLHNHTSLLEIENVPILNDVDSGHTSVHLLKDSDSATQLSPNTKLYRLIV